MKVFLVLVCVLLSLNNSLANTEFCFEKAKEWQSLLHQKNLADIGTIQGYSEEQSHRVVSVRHEMDNATETYYFFVDAQNDEGNSWTWGYRVVVEAWLGGDGKAWLCSVLKAEYRGVLQ